MELTVGTKIVAGVLLITVPSIQYGGTYLLQLLTDHDRTYTENPLRQGFFRAGHAHAGVLVILSLVIQLLVDGIGKAPVWAEWIARLGIPVAAVLMPLGFFLSVASPGAAKPNGWIRSLWVGVAALAASVLTLGILLIHSALQ